MSGCSEIFPSVRPKRLGFCAPPPFVCHRYQQSLFPGTTYEYVSGGDPPYILSELSCEGVYIVSRFSQHNSTRFSQLNSEIVTDGVAYFFASFCGCVCGAHSLGDRWVIASPALVCLGLLRARVLIAGCEGRHEMVGDLGRELGRGTHGCVVERW